MNAEFDSIFRLARAERLQLVEDIWNSIAAEEEELPVSEAKLAELRTRKQRLLEQPASGRSWEQLKHTARTGND